MIIWHGNGILVGIIAFLAAVLTQLGFDRWVAPHYYSTHLWTIGVAMFLASGPCWALGDYFRKKNPQQLHSFFFIPMRFWGPVLIGIGIVLCIMEFVR